MTQEEAKTLADALAKRVTGACAVTTGPVFTRDEEGRDMSNRVDVGVGMLQRIVSEEVLALLLGEVVPKD